MIRHARQINLQDLPGHSIPLVRGWGRIAISEQLEPRRRSSRPLLGVEKEAKTEFDYAIRSQQRTGRRREGLRLPERFERGLVEPV